jgi:hypothetical protein
MQTLSHRSLHAIPDPVKRLSQSQDYTQHSNLQTLKAAADVNKGHLQNQRRSKPHLISNSCSATRNVCSNCYALRETMAGGAHIYCSIFALWSNCHRLEARNARGEAEEGAEVLK